MAREGWPFVLGALLVTVIGVLLAQWHSGFWYILAAIGLIATCFMAYFFRDPTRTVPNEEGIVVSPGDGRVLSVTTHDDATSEIHIFLSVFDVHVNRAPIAGRVTATTYRPGKFVAAMKPEAGKQNERQDISMDGSLGRVDFAQIAGVLARRIVCRIHEGDELQIGDRIGMIRFGSRVEIVLPPGIEPTLEVGQMVRGGETIVGRRVGQNA